MGKIKLTDDERAALLVRRVAGAFSCLLIGPGAGQLAMGHKLRAAIWFLLAVITVIPGPLISIWLFYANFPLRVFAGIDVLLIKPPGFTSSAQSPLAGLPRWMAVIGLWCGLMAATFGLKMGAPTLYMGVLAVDARMSPAAYPQELVFVNRLATPNVGDVVAYESTEKKRTIRLARVVAKAGQRAAVKNGRLVLADKPQPRKPITDIPCAFEDVVAGKKADDPVKLVNVQCVGFIETLGKRRFWVSEPKADKTAASDAISRVVATGHALLRHDNRAAGGGIAEGGGFVTVKNSQILGVARAIWKSAGKGGLRWGRLGASLTWQQ
jgi:hypothetical protein